jgi:tryptophan halogenase
MKKVKSIIIVGGGSSGWMTAAYLSTVLFDVDISLIESRTTPRIGVGEATTPILTRFMRRLGFNSHRQWLSACDGTIKTGILFENWCRVGERYWHPFESLDYVDERYHVGHCWLNFHRQGESGFAARESFYEQFYVSTLANARHNRGPVLDTFAFHLNADRFGDFLRRSSRGVRHIEDDVLDLELNEQGEIARIITAEHGKLEADLFIDCTGFRGRLIRRLEQQPYESYSSSLLCDRAVVLRFPYQHASGEGKAAELLPYVLASARSSGWIWTIPLHSGISSGYVYSSEFLTESQAEEELRNYWGRQRTQGAVPLQVRFCSGKLPRVWVKNCVAIGLSGSFIEPLESTGLAITQTGIELLASMLDARYFDTRMIDRYNLQVEKFCDDVKQFIVAHYCLTERDDTPFWRHVKHDTRIPEDLAARLEVFRRYLPSSSTKGTQEQWFFAELSWFSVLLGMNFPFLTPDVPASILAGARSIHKKKMEKIEKLLRTSKSHLDYLCSEIYGEPADLQTCPVADGCNFARAEGRGAHV